MARDLERERRRVDLVKRIHTLTRILKLGKPLLFGLFVSGIIIVNKKFSVLLRLYICTAIG
jgi:hypothetical protein